MSKVTVTLGRDGRVVKRGGPPWSDDEFSDPIPVGGSKRSVRDRLGSSYDDSFSNAGQLNKRLRVESGRTTISTNSLNDVRLGKDDLRYKLMRKNIFKQTQKDNPQNGVDLRDRLSKRDMRPVVDSKPAHSPEVKSIRWAEPPPHPRQSRAETRDSSLFGQSPSSRGSSLVLVDPPRTSHSSWTSDALRRRSPDRVLRSTYRGLSPERNVEELQRRSLIRAYDDGKPNPYMRNHVIGPSRPASSAAFLPKPSLPPASAKTGASFIPQLPQASGMAPKIAFMGDEHGTVESLLLSLGLEKYAILFKAEEVDMHALRQMGDGDLKELGVPMGPRKKILQAVMVRFRRNP